MSPSNKRLSAVSNTSLPTSEDGIVDERRQSVAQHDEICTVKSPRLARRATASTTLLLHSPPTNAEVNGKPSSKACDGRLEAEDTRVDGHCTCTFSKRDSANHKFCYDTENGIQKKFKDENVANEAVKPRATFDGKSCVSICFRC